MLITFIQLKRFKCFIKWYSMGIFYSHFYWFITFYKNKYYLLVYLDNCSYKIAAKRMIYYISENPFETDND